MAAIPTIYRGVRFRSRLEAKWAAFFDLLNWKWDYEPIDLDGWIPDFVLHKAFGKRALVEVKPIYEPDKEVVAKILTAMKSEGRTEPVLLLGVGIGWLRVIDEDGQPAWSEYQFDGYPWTNAWVEAGNVAQWRPHR